MADQRQQGKGFADIVFLVDVTGSMQPCIDGLKRNIEAFIDTLTAKGANNSNPVKDWRAKIVGYRDFGDNEAEPFADNPFVREAAALKAQLAELSAAGGGDEPEALLDALYKIASMAQTARDAPEEVDKWRYRSAAARVVIVFTDASYKETMTIPEAAGGTVIDVINVCMTNRILLNVFAPEGLPGYDKLATLNKSEYYPIAGSDPQKALEDFTSDQKNFGKVLEQLARTVSKSSEVVTA